MKFALFSHVPWPEGGDPQRIFHEITEEVQYGEELGFHSAWFAEHHFSRYGLGSSALVLAGSIASQTKSIRLGTGVLLPGFHHPIRLAEDATTVDTISRGRLDVGFGRGSAAYEYKAFNIDQEGSQNRFQENIRIIQGLWTTHDYSHDGAYYSVNRANIVPPPVQKPHPPIYIAASRTPATLKFVVSTGHPLIVGMVLDTSDALDLSHRFVAMSREEGYNIPMSRIPFLRYLYVAATDREARRDTEDAMNWVQDMTQWRRTFSESSEVHHQLEQWRKTRTELPLSYEHLYENRAIFGTPERCVAKIKELQREGIEYFGCNMAFGGMEHTKLMRSMQLFAEEVMPHFID